MDFLGTILCISLVFSKWTDSQAMERHLEGISAVKLIQQINQNYFLRNEHYAAGLKKLWTQLTLKTDDEISESM